MRHLFVLFSLLAFCSTSQGKTCVHINSYHKGYTWSDEIEKGLVDHLKGVCKLKIFRMDTKHNTSPKFMKQMGLKAKAFIENNQPDVVTISDDNAVREVLIPYFKNHQIPFVFSGLNWTISQYGLPFKNTTGMIEVAPIQAMIEELNKKLKPQSVAFLSADVVTQRKSLKNIGRIFEANGIKVKPFLVKDMAAWKSSFIEAQNSDFIYLSNNAGIQDWNKDDAQKLVTKESKKIVVSTYEWMAPYAVFTISRSAYEHGEWSAQQAKKILEGKKPNRITVTTNRKFNAIYNPTLHKKSPIKLSADFLKKAKKFSDKMPAANR